MKIRVIYFTWCVEDQWMRKTWRLVLKFLWICRAFLKAKFKFKICKINNRFSAKFLALIEQIITSRTLQISRRSVIFNYLNYQKNFPQFFSHPTHKFHFYFSTHFIEYCRSSIHRLSSMKTLQKKIIFFIFLFFLISLIFISLSSQ